MNEIRKNIIDEAKRIEEDCKYSRKGHFNAAARWCKINLFLGLSAALSSAAAGVIIYADFEHHLTWAISFALMGATFAAIVTFLNPNEKAYVHSRSGDRYTVLKNEARRFYKIDCTDDDTIEQLREHFDDLGKKHNDLLEAAPLIPQWAYRKSKKGIIVGEEDYDVDK